jgi:hypothetical protein
MEHAGFDALHNPTGAMLVCMALLLVTAVIIFGSLMVKMAMQRDAAMRAELRKAKEERKNR